MPRRAARIAILPAVALIITWSWAATALADDVVYSQPPLFADGGSFPSEVNSAQRADDWVANTSSTITSIRWWGTTAGSSGTGNFTLRIFGNAGGAPGSLIHQFAIGTSFTKTATGLTDINGRDIYKYEASLPDGGFVPTLSATYWINMINNQSLAGGRNWLWHQGGSGNNAHAFRVGTGSWNSEDGDLAFELITPPPPPPSCPGDLNDNGTVDVDDLLIVINNWDNAGGPGDANENGAVDVDDLLIIINAWGPCS